MLVQSFSRAFAQLPDPAFRGILAKALALSVAVSVALVVLAHYALQHLVTLDGGWLDVLAHAAGLAAALVALFLLFPAIGSLALSLFLDEVAGAVERQHYPALAASAGPGARTALALSVRFAAVTLSVNLLMLPLYLALLFIPPLNIFVFYGVNGYLLGREYFELVSARHRTPSAVRQLRKQNRWRVFAAGVLIALLATVPIVHLLAPLVGTAAMVHLFAGLDARDAV